ncbi:MAG: sigma-70 family RNA polymerase sigma factor, partial [Candidatus Cloacimonadota bacterium]|nr:sigma-70 family RNA polymerase sigma factor [Candidatus Cloacimonadota bacterium]
MASDFNIDFEKELKELAPLIKKIASNFITSNITADELFQEGMLGVYEAKQKYNPKKDTKFSTYAYFWIKKYIMKYVGVEKFKYEFNDKLLQNKIDEKQKEDLPK